MSYKLGNHLCERCSRIIPDSGFGCFSIRGRTATHWPRRLGKNRWLDFCSEYCDFVFQHGKKAWRARQNQVRTVIT